MIQPSIRSISATDDLDALTQLLHRAYKQLLDMGLRYTATNQSVEITRDRISNANCFVLTLEERIIGTATVKIDHDHPVGVYYHRPGVWLFTQFALEPAYQSRGWGRLLLDYCEEFVRQHGGTELALDTAEDAAHLISFYQRRGYQIVDTIDYPNTNYLSVVMSKSLV